MKPKLKTFHIETNQNGSFNFFTGALNHKLALLNLIVNSSDFKNIVKDNSDLIISIKEVKP